MDLDDARTFAAALDGIDRLFVMTGYTVAMTHPTKTITDAAADAGVGHIVHLGIFGDGRGAIDVKGAGGEVHATGRALERRHSRSWVRGGQGRRADRSYCWRTARSDSLTDRVEASTAVGS